MILLKGHSITAILHSEAGYKLLSAEFLHFIHYLIIFGVSYVLIHIIVEQRYSNVSNNQPISHLLPLKNIDWISVSHIYQISTYRQEIQ